MRGTHIGVYGPFIVATTMSSAPKKRGCSARCGGPVAMATAGVKDGGWWLACGVCGQNERQPASQHCFKGKYDRNERRCRIDSAKEVKRKGKKKKKKTLSKNGCLKHSTR